MLVLNMAAIGIVLYFTDEDREKESRKEIILQFLFLAIAGVPCSFVILIAQLSQIYGRKKDGKL